MFYQGGPIDHCKHVPGSVAQFSADVEYKASCTVGTVISHYRIPDNQLLNKDSDVVLEQAHCNYIR